MQAISKAPPSPVADQGSRATSAADLPSFSSRVSPLSAPPPSSYVTATRLAFTCAQAMPMLAAIRWAARPAPGIHPDAVEAEGNLPRQTDVVQRQAAIVVSQATLAASPMLLNPPAANNLRWLAQGFQLVLGSGFFGCQRLEDAPGGKLRIAVFDGFKGKTVWHTEGPLGQTVARSAALPVLFANDGFLDGGWVDHHGYTALRPNERALSLRINTGIEPDTMQKLVHRPTPLFNVSEDAEHKTVCFKPAQKIDPSTFLFDIDFRKDKLIHIMEESEQLMKWWLFQPEAA